MKVRFVLGIVLIVFFYSCSKEPRYDLQWRNLELTVGWINNLEDTLEIRAWDSGFLKFIRSVAPADTHSISYNGETPNPYIHIQNLIPCAACPDSLTIEIKDTCFKASILNPDELLLGWENAFVDTDSVRYVRGYFNIDSTTIQNTLTCD